MEVRPGESEGKAGSRGSGPGSRRKRSDSIGARKDVIIRMPEAVARQLKIVAAYEDTTITDFCLEAIIPKIAKAMEKHGMHLDK
jgi:hypothetical protein